jgi:hypothetical protein
VHPSEPRFGPSCGLTTALLCSLAGASFGASPTTVTLAASPNPTTFGQPVLLTATVAPAPSGKVTFYDGAAMLGSSPLASGTAARATTLLPSGTRFLHASYSGDSTYAFSTSPILTQTVNTVPTSGFSPGIDFATRSPVPPIAVGDFNGDGAVDIAVASGAENQVQVFLATQTGPSRRWPIIRLGRIRWRCSRW